MMTVIKFGWGTSKGFFDGWTWAVEELEKRGFSPTPAFRLTAGDKFDIFKEREITLSEIPDYVGKKFHPRDKEELSQEDFSWAIKLAARERVHFPGNREVVLIADRFLRRKATISDLRAAVKAAKEEEISPTKGE